MLLKNASGNSTTNINEFEARTNTKPPITFSSVCPAIIFANNLTERLIGRER